MVWLDGENTVPSCRAGIECGGGDSPCFVDSALGRVYCSVICPLGVFQDIISWVSGKVKKNRFRYSPALSWLRYGVLAVFVVALVAGAVSLAALIAPYSAYGRIVSNLLTPLYQWGNNVLVLWAERVDSYAFIR